MPEEKKKESFTFSDKIKNSKPANSKSFAKRSSSKIGSDGKPRQTLFERTKRDAPFFIAALVALLLLPFLYKYSGNAEEEPTLVTPGYEDSAFNPERSGFDGFAVDPEGQIAQLTGRDPLELIGLGRKATEEVNEDEDFLERSAYSGEGSSASHSLDEQDEEENTTNIYQYRKKAPAATRAAFRRAATPINRLPGAQRAGASGSRLGVGMWGGSIKPAANKVKGSSPQSAPKPVSLQPLQAAGKPTKAYFGQPNSQLARKSKDAMSKGNAMQALMDSNFKPVEPGKFGGVIGGDFGGPGGGKGDMKREFNYNAKEPWWWDMMKQQAMMDWKAKFDLKWKAINKLADIGLHWLEGILNCLFTGNSDGDMDSFLGSGGGASGKAAKCCGKERAIAEPLIKQAGGTWGKNGCKTLQLSLGKDKCPEGWEGGRDGGEARVGFFAQRGKCFGAAVGKYTAGDLGLNEGAGVPCDDLPHYYRVNPSGEARKWNIYTYVVARNYVPKAVWDVFQTLNPTARRGYLCTEADDHYEIGKKASAGVSETALPDTYEKTGTVSEKSNTYKSRDRYSKEQNLLADMYERNPEDLRNGCVIYQVKSDTFNYKNFETEMVGRFEKLLKEKGGVKEEEAAAKAREAFLQLDLMFVESVATKDKLGYAAWGRTGHQVEDLPMVYHRFEDIFIRHKKSTASATGSRTNVDNRKYRVPNVDMVQGDRCYFKQDIALSCEDLVNDETGNPVAHVVFKKSYKGGAPINAAEEAKNLVVTAQYTAAAYAASNQKVGRAGMVQTLNGPSVSSDGQTLTYTFKNILDVMGQPARSFAASMSSEPTTTTETSDDGNGGTTTTTRTESSESFGFVGKVTWTVKRKSDADGAALKAECAINTSGDGSTVTVNNKNCNNKDESEKCCRYFVQLAGLIYGKDYTYKNGKCIQLKIQIPECKDMHTSKRCCELMHDPKWGDRYGTDYTYNEQTQRCEPIRVPSEKRFVHFAPIISWVPNGLECRRPKDKPEERLTKSHFPSSSCTRYVPPAERDENTTTHQHCGLQEQIVMDSKAAYDFVMEVADRYNEQAEVQSGQRNPISKELEHPNYPTDGEFIDALQMAAKLGIKEVSSAAVCELGRDMIRMSRDPHVGDRRADSEGNYKNDLGAFLAYIHETSVLYPNIWYKESEGNCDWRFIPEGASCKGRASTVKMGKAFYFNKYNDSSRTKGYPNAVLKRYTDSLDAVGIGQKYPLNALVKGKRDIPHNCPVTVCQQERKKYSPTFRGLLRDNPDQVGQGIACEAFVGGANVKMSVADALTYVSHVCKIGLDVKPYGGTIREVTYRHGQTFTGSGSSGNAGDSTTHRKGSN